MKTVTKEIKLYNIKELPEEVRNKMIEKEAEKIREDYLDYCFEEDMKNEAEYLLEQAFNMYIKVDSVLYDFSYSYGDGCNVEFSIYLEDLNKKYKIFTNSEIKHFHGRGGTLIKVYHYGNGGYYSNNISIEEDLGSVADYIDAFDKKIKKIYEKIDLLREKLHDDVTEINSKLRTYGYDVIENEEDYKEQAFEYLNETTYTIDGKLTFEDINNL